MRRLAVIALVFASGLPAFAAGIGQFQMVGSQILDPAGNPFVIRGVNVQGANSWWFAQPRDIALDASLIADAWKFNAIRLNGFILPENTSWTDPRNNDLDRIVNAYTSKHVVVMFAPLDRTGGYFQDYVGSDGVAHNDLTALNNYYYDLATRYKGNPYVWFNVMNEPGTGMPDVPKWLQVNQSVIQTIRGTGAQNVIVTDGANYGQDTGGNYGPGFLTDDQSAILSYGRQLQSFGGQDYQNILYSFHVYSEWRAGGAAKLADYIARVQAQNLPLIVGEYGSDSAETRAILQLAESQGLGRMAWHWQDGAPYTLTTEGGGFAINDLNNPTNLTSFGQLVWDDAHSAVVPEPRALGLGMVMLGVMALTRHRRVYSRDNAAVVNAATVCRYV